MRAKLHQVLHRLLSSYWFIPATMSAGAIVLSFAAILLDGWLGSHWLHDIAWLWSNQPDGAQAVLSTLAGSMITVGGVTFSVTIAAVAYTSSQLAPRLLTNFMEDRGNQVTLGTFVATFLYCLLVLRTVRSGASGPMGEETVFVPHVSILIATALAIASVGMLIYFMHHIPESIHVSNVIATIGNELIGQIETSFPGGVGFPSEQAAGEVTEGLPEQFNRRAVLVTSNITGYVQNLDPVDLVNISKKHDLVVELLAQPGDYVMVDQPLLLAYPPENVDDAAIRVLRKSFACGGRRTPSQDAMFLVNELAEIAARALSPGVNEPFTAISCLHWLKNALATVARRGEPAAVRYDREGVLRVMTHPYRFDDFTEAAFEQLRPYVSEDRNVSLVYLQCLKDLVVGVTSDEHRRILVGLGSVLYAETGSLSSRDRQTLEDSLSELLRLQSGSDAREAYLRQKQFSDGGG